MKKAYKVIAVLVAVLTMTMLLATQAFAEEDEIPVVTFFGFSAGEASCKPIESSIDAAQYNAPAAEAYHTHNYVEKVVPATCLAGGYTSHTCSCGDSYRDNFTEKTGHKYIAKQIMPTYTENGYILKACAYCDYSEILYVAPTVEAAPYDIVYAMNVAFEYADQRFTANLSCTPETSGWDPFTDVTGSFLKNHGGVDWLIKELNDTTDYMFTQLSRSYGNRDDWENGKGIGYRPYIRYEASTDTYYIYGLYGGGSRGLEILYETN